MEIKWQEIELSKLVGAPWNYKKDFEYLEEKLINNIKKNGIIENIIVREIEGDKFEVVNGNHRLKACVKIGLEKIMCCNLGNIKLRVAKRIAIETNETKFPNDKSKLGDILSDLLDGFGLDDIVATTPWSRDEIEKLAKVDIDDITASDSNDIPPSSFEVENVIKIPADDEALSIWNEWVEQCSGDELYAFKTAINASLTSK